MPSNSTFGWRASVPMKKLLNKPWFAAVLAAAALLLVGRAVLSGPRAPAYADAAAPAVAPAESETVPAPAAPLPVKDALQALFIPAILRDPFALRARVDNTATAAAKAELPDLVETVHLSALWTQDGATYVLLNGRVCQAGEEVGRIKIESATQEGVWVTHWKGRNFITLGGDFTLNTPAGRNAGAATTL